MYLNIKLKDGAFLESYYDDATCISYNYFIDLDDTYEFDEDYINDIHITTTNYEMKVYIKEDSHFGFTTADAIMIFTADLKSMTELEFLNYLEKSFKNFNVETLEWCKKP